MKSKTKLLVCDLDNTLYDWVGFFVPSFYAMVGEAAKILNCDSEVLLDDLRAVHQKHNDSEHPFALLETDIVQTILSNFDSGERRRILDPAFKAFNTIRKEKLKLYPGVHDTLKTLSERGVTLIAHTESRIYSVVFRLKLLGLVETFERVYCLERPPNTLTDSGRLKSFWDGIPTNRFTELSLHQRKPNPSVLSEIFRDFDLTADDTAYVGDSMAKDVYMAKQANSFAIWAEYGTHHERSDYEQLVRITHWSASEVEREAQLRANAANVVPDFVARTSFSELLACLT